MDIWLLERDAENDPASWDAMRSCVVVAPNSFQARRMAAPLHGDEGADAWISGATTTHIGTAFPDVQPGVVARNWTER
jgi:hypothetical protein